MAWQTTTSKTTRHTCGGPVFGHKTPGCPRCDELLSGAEPVRWDIPAGRISRAEQERQDDIARLQHYASPRHNNPNHPHYCGSVCTYGDW